MNEKYMEIAYEEALLAYEKGEVPVGAVIVCNNRVIARAHNLRETMQKVSGHAEFLAIEKASEELKTWRLNECDLYVTLEPCAMCAGAIIQARINNVYYSTKDLKSGVAGSIIDLFEIPFNHKVNVFHIDDNNRSEKLLKNFFKDLRKK